MRIEDDFFCVKPEIIKCQDFIFLITEEEKVEYSSTESLVSLKFRLIEREVFELIWKAPIL